jgi:putative peptidoglycan lipid II flippase
MSPAARSPTRVTTVAAGTLVSRATGLLRVLVLAYVLGFTPLSDAFNLANTVPNMLFDLVLGGIASATFIPVFVERLAIDGERRAWRSISTVVTAALGVLVVASGLAWLLAPYVIDAFTILGHATPGRDAAEFALQRSVATTFLRWFVPQIFFYGVIGIATALLNVRHRFGAPAWVPIANNGVCIAVLFWFHLVDPNPTLANVHGTSTLAWLALGTTLGVAVQAALLVPSLARANLWRLSFRFDRHDPALRTISRLGSWTLLVVLTNQLSLYVVLAFAFGIGGSGPISAYTYGWSFMQMPYAVVVVSVLNVMTPRLAALSTSGDDAEFTKRLSIGLRQSLVIIIPLSATLVVLAQPIVAVLLNHANATHTLEAGTVLAVLAAGLPGFTLFQVAVRGLQTRQHARDTFWLYVFQNIATVLIAFAIGRHNLGGLTASVSIAYALAALAAVATLSYRGASLWGALIAAPIVRSLAAALIAAVVMAVVYNVRDWVTGAGLVVRLVLAVVSGCVVYGGLLVLSHRRGRSHHRHRVTQRVPDTVEGA